MSLQAVRSITGGHVLARPGRGPAVAGQALHVDGGNIAAEPGDGGVTLDLPGGLVLPAPSNGHDHGKAVSNLAHGAVDDALEYWLPTMGAAPPVPMDLMATAFLCRTARSGVAGCVILTVLKDPEAAIADAVAVAAAAHAVGVRVGFAVAMQDTRLVALGIDDPTAELLSHCGLDASEIPYLPKSSLSAGEWIELVEEIARRVESDLVQVQFGPLGPHWVTDGLTEAIATRSAETGRRIHMHLLETRRQREWADAMYPDGIVRHLDALGLLSERLAVAHGVWLRPDEIDLLAERGVTVSINTSSNLALRSGIAPVHEVVGRGLAFAVGLDGRGLDDDGDFLRELRLLTRLHGGTGLSPDLDIGTVWEAATTSGATVVSGGAGPWGLTPGVPADLLVLDRSRLDADVLEPHRDHARLVASRATTAHVQHLVVAGRHVVRDGLAAGVDESAAVADLQERFFALGASHSERSRFLAKLRPALEHHYELGHHTAPARLGSSG